MKILICAILSLLLLSSCKEKENTQNSIGLNSKGEEIVIDSNFGKMPDSVSR